MSYLRFFKDGAGPSASVGASLDYDDPKALVEILEKRAACVVRQYALNLRDPDASMEQRVAKAVMDGFVANQILEILEETKSILGPEELFIFTLVSRLVRRSTK